MRKILLLFVASFFVASFVSGRGERGIPSVLIAQADTTKQGTNEVVVPMFGGDYVYIPGATTPSSLSAIDMDTLTRPLSKPNGNDTVVLATLKPASDSVRAVLRNSRFKSVVIWGGGRDRYGAFTEECAAHANGRLRKFGIYSYGHAYQIPSHFHPVVNGYLNVTIPSINKLAWTEKVKAILDAHRKASDYIRDNFDISMLNPKKYYVVNMYYSTSPHMLEFFVAARNQGTNNYGTHVGVLYFDKRSQDWVVEHNIHGNVHRNSLRSVLGGKSNPHKYGVTTIYRASPTE